ncbi:MAG: hypothetical protein ACOVQ7_15750 [Limnoraphis robusta]
MIAQIDVELYHTPILYAVDEDCYQPIKLTIEQRRQRWLEHRWLGEPETIQDDWLFAPLPSEFDEF